MQFKLPTSFKMCLGTCVAALILGLQNIDEYCEQFESNYAEHATLAKAVKEVAYSTYLPGLYGREKALFTAFTQLFPTIGGCKEEAPPPPPAPKIVYVRVPSLRQLNSFRALPREKESTLIPADLISQPQVDFLPQTSTEKEVETPTETEHTESTASTPQPEQPTPPTTQQPEQVTEPELTPEDIRKENEQTPVHYRIMMLGDSLMEDLGPTTHRTLRHRKGLHFILTAKYSTGLSRPDYFNWPKNMEKAVSGTRPDIIVFFMGANDGMPIKENGRNIYPNSGEAWKKAYRAKMAELFEIGRRYNCEMLWIGLPPMGSRYAKILAQTAQAQQEGCLEHGIRFIDTAQILGDEKGDFRTYMTDKSGNTIRLRDKDKEHLAAAGNKLVVEQLLPILEQSIADFRKKHPEKQLSEQEAARPGRAPLDITIKYVPGKR